MTIPESDFISSSEAALYRRIEELEQELAAKDRDLASARQLVSRRTVYRKWGKIVRRCARDEACAALLNVLLSKPIEFSEQYMNRLDDELFGA